MFDMCVTLYRLFIIYLLGAFWTVAVDLVAPRFCFNSKCWCCGPPQGNPEGLNPLEKELGRKGWEISPRPSSSAHFWSCLTRFQVFLNCRKWMPKNGDVKKYCMMYGMMGEFIENWIWINWNLKDVWTLEDRFLAGQRWAIDVWFSQ